MKLRYVFAFVFVLMLVFGVSVMAKKVNLQACDGSDNLFGYALSKNSGYETFSYFSPEFEYLGMEQYDGEGNLLIDTFEGVC